MMARRVSFSASDITEILFIDRGVPDAAALLAGVRPGVHVHLLDPQRDALAQIADAIEGRRSKTIHVVTHGAPGLLAFSSGALSNATLAGHADDLARIAAALPADAEILLWGCDVGSGAAGEAFVDALTEATGAYVAAATHRIGAGSAESWILDVARMPMAAQVPFRPETIAAYQGVLATRLWYVTSGEQASEAGLSVINANGTNQQIDFVSDTSFGLGSSWIETVADPSAGTSGFYFVLEENIASGGSATLYRGVLGSAAAPTAVVDFGSDVVNNSNDADVIGGLQIDTVNHHIYVGYTDYDDTTNFNNQPATTGIIQMNYDPTTGAITNTTNFLINEQTTPIPNDALGYYAPADFALGDGGLFFVQQAFETSNEIYRVDLADPTQIHTVVQQSQFPANWSGGVINDVEIDTADHLLFFSVHDENQPGTNNGIYYLSDTATGSTAATQLALPGISANFSPNNLLFDQATRVLYVTSEETSDGPGNGVPDDVIYAFQLDGLGTTATILGTFGPGFSDDPTGAVANIGGMFLVQNVVPTLTGLDPVTFAENTVNASPQIIDSAVVFNDTDDTDYSGGSMTVSYSAGGGAQNNLSVHNFGSGAGQIGVSGATISYEGNAFATITTNGASGANLVISFDNAFATPTSIDALIQALQYQNTSDTPAPTRTVRIVVTDPSGASSTAVTSLITVNAENDAPALAGLDPATFAENTVNAAPQIIDSAVTLTDPDSANFNGGNVTVTYTAAGLPEDNLSIHNFGTGATQIGVSGASVTYEGVTIGTITTNGASGANLVVSLNASATPTAVDALIEALQYQDTSDTPTATRTVSITVNDGDGGTSTAATSLITVNAGNDAPDLAVPASLSGTAGNPITVTGVSFSDVDSGGLSEEATFTAAAGSTFTATSGGGVTVSGSGTNTIHLDGTIANLNSFIAGNGLTFTTSANDTIHASIDDQGHTGTPGALQSATRDISVNVNAPPSVPIDNDGTANAVTEGAAVDALVGLTALSTDSDGGTVTYSLTVNPGGFFKIDANSGLVSVSAAGATGIDYESAPGHAYSVTVQADDGQGGQTTQSFSIAVNDVAPSAPSDNNGAANTVVEGAAANTLVGITALATDVNGGTPTYALTNDANGAFQIDANTGVVSVADPSKIDYEGSGPSHTLTITVKANDGTVDGATQDFTIAVTNANPTTPVDSDGTANAITEGAGAGTVVHVTAASTDVNGPPVTYSLTDSAGGFFTIDSTTGIVTVDTAGAAGINYETAPGHAYSITVQASDGSGGISTSTFSIAVNDVAPAATGDTYAVDEDQTLAPVLASGLLANDSDVNGGPITSVLDAGPAHAASFTLNPDGTFSYTPVANYNGPDSFTYHAFDGSQSSGIVSVNLTVNPVNDPPVLAGLGDTPTFVENGSAVLLDSNGNAAVSDIELDAAASYAGASLTLARNGGPNADDFFSGTGSLDLSDFNINGENVSLDNGATFIGTYTQVGDGTFSIVFNSNAHAADIDSVMRQIVYSNTSENPPASAQINFTFSDGNGDPNGQPQGSGATPGTTTASVTVNITQVDDPPVLLSVAPTALYGIGSSGVVLSLGLQVFDPDAAPPSPNVGLASATIKIASGFLPTDQLFVNLQTSGGFFVRPDNVVTNISVQSNAGGVLVLSGTDSVVDYQAVLDAVSYRSTAVDPTNGGADPHRTITWEVSDGVLTNQNPNPLPAPPFPETILGFDAPPTVDLDASAPGTGFTTSFTENGAAVAIADTDVSITDPDNAALTSLTVVLTNAMAGDSLLFAGTLPVGVGETVDTSVAGKITLTLFGSASLADYQTALGNIRFSVAGDNPSTVARDITVVANDGGADSNVAHATVNVIAVNDPPVLDLDASGAGTGFATSFTENGAAVAIVDSDVLITDVDNTTLSSAKVVLTNAMAGDALSIAGSLPAGIVSSIDTSVPGQITLTLSGSATLASYQTALGDIRFGVAGDNPSTVARDIAVTVNDGGADSNTAHATVNVIAVNDPPVLDLDASGVGTGFTTRFTERHAPVAIVDTDVSITDPDNTALSSATIVLTNAMPGDHLSIAGSLPGGIGNSINTSVPGQITVTLSGAASLADYQTALGDIRFSVSGDNPSTIARDIAIKVNDGGLDSNTAHATVNVTSIQPNDFDFNGASDILWQNSGVVAEWQMNNSQIAGNFGVGVLDSTWHFLDTGDFNADGRADALWQNTSGQVALWTLNGQQIVGNQTVGFLDPSWHNEGVGDFNGDGHSDVLWLNDSGQVVIWTMNGAQITGNQEVAHIGADLHIAGILDTGLDGKSDILLRSTNGQVSLWTMNGATITSNNLIGNVGVDWNVAGTGDFNGDGHEDILWRNDDGQVVLWTMNGSQITSNTSVAVVSPDWHIQSVGDYNHDSHSDVLWRNDNGQVVIWEMNGAQIAGNHTVTNVGGGAASISLDWTVLTHHYDVL